ncbi:Fic/DOC family protein [Deinococcus humi]|uniref:protein adenylyltransferase n=1 Tax=Deinococcus humi TaxID=662880 RepID=A0A7W8K283_9DEIO|nr:Fic family protein [Deinococcus humi]MBB5365934.1 fido (protein-threonine AMPylation protein) [Deinococcus humi]GGO40395.1 hypothetical protein GCM10008949_49810 [Deinococcus humi]
MPKPFAFFSFDNGVPKNRLGLDNAEALALVERDLTFTRMAEIHEGSAPEATRGTFDLEHLRAIHQHIFQDVYEWAGTTRNHTLRVEGQQVEPPASMYKDDGRLPLRFVPSRLVESSLNATFDALREQNHLQGLSREEFAERAAVAFAHINDAHPFMEGNGRTQREFISQLAEQAGHSLNFDVVSAERMSIVSYEARAGDLGGMRRLFQEISDPTRVAVLGHAQEVLSARHFDWQSTYITTAIPGEHYSGVKAFHDPDTLIIREDREFILVAQSGDVPPQGVRVDFTASPYPQPDVQAQLQTEPVTLKGLSLEDFAVAAARRLAATVQGGDLSPTQVRETARELAQAGERKVNLNVITEERLGRDVQAARQGQVQGFERMFQEAGHPPTVQLMQRAMHSLELQGRDPQGLYLTAAQPGQQYEGRVETRNVRAAVIADSEGRHLVTHPASLKGAVELEHGRVQFTAQDGQRNQMQMEL